MAKKAYAATNIKHNDEFIVAGEPVDPAKFTRKELQELYDAGALEVRDDDDPRNKLAPTPADDKEASKPGDLADLETMDDTQANDDRPVSSAAAAASTKAGPEEEQTTGEVVKEASTGKATKATTDAKSTTDKK